MNTSGVGTGLSTMTKSAERVLQSGYMGLTEVPPGTVS